MVRRFLTSLLGSFLAAAPVFATPTAPSSVPPETIAKEIREGQAILIDVREPEETAQGQIEGALTFPSSQLDTPAWNKFVAKLPKKQIYTYCAHGRRADRVATKLQGQGLRAKSAGGYEHLKVAFQKK